MIRGSVITIAISIGLAATASAQLVLPGSGGGSTSPGGSNTQLQYNNSSSFGGVSGATSNGTSITFTTGNLILNSQALHISGNTGTIATVTGSLTSGNCLQSDAAHNLVDSGSTNCGGGGGGGSPGGATTQVQFNNAGAFAGDAGFTYTTPAAVIITSGIVTTTARSLSIFQTWNSSGASFDAPLFMNVTNTSSHAGAQAVDIQVGGSSIFSVMASDNASQINWNAGGNSFRIGRTSQDITMAFDNSNSIFSFNDKSNNQAMAFRVVGAVGGGSSVQISNNTQFSWTNGGQSAFTPDTSLWRDAAVTVLALGNVSAGTTAAGFRVYNTTNQVGGSNTAPTNYERGIADWTTTTNAFVVGTQNSGTGVGRTMYLVASNTLAMSVSPTINLYGQTNPSANETYAVCAGSGATSLTSGGQVFVDTTACLASSMMVKHDIAAFNDYGMTKLASLAEPLRAENRLATAPINVDPIAEAMALVPVVATYDTIDSNPQFTLIAQNACQIDERLCERTRDGTVRAFRPNAVIAVLIAAFQKQQAQIEDLQRRIGR